MAMNYSGTWNQPKSANNSTTTFTADSGPYIGIVMNNVDPLKSGRVEVWLKTHSSDTKDNPDYWRTVSYLSPFYGTTPFELNDTSESKLEKNGESYGMWFTSPDVGVEVLCFFVEGNPNLGYYVGYIPQPQMNHMIPATGARNTSDADLTAEETSAYSNTARIPVSELSKSTENNNNPDFYNIKKPVHAMLASQMWQQGTISDPIRGPIGTSVQRESPSYAYGISTPGRPVYKGGFNETNISSIKNNQSVLTKDNTKVLSRRPGHSFSMDDGDQNGKDVLMRLRSSSGHQITMSDDGSCIYIQHGNGQTWLEFGNEGTIDIYASNSVNIRTQGEMNFHADKNINFYSGQDINMFAKQNIKYEADKNFDIIGKMYLKTFSDKKILIKSEGTTAMESKNNTSIKSSKNIIEDGAMIYMNTFSGDSIQKPENILHTSLSDTEISGPNAWESKPGILDTIVSRAPTHEPWAEHNSGVPNTIVLGAPSVPQGQPAPSKTQEKIKQAKSSPPLDHPIQKSDVAKTASESNIIDVGNIPKEKIVSVLSQREKEIKDSGKNPGIGPLGLSIDSLKDDLQIFKPGIIPEGLNLSEIIDYASDPSVFTGAFGINNLSDLLDKDNQMSLAQESMKKAGKILQSAGKLTGYESPEDYLGIVSSALNTNAAKISSWISGEASGKIDSIVENVSGIAENVSENLDNILLDNIQMAKNAINVGEKSKDIIKGIIDGTVQKSNIEHIVGNTSREALDKAQKNLWPASIRNLIPDPDLFSKQIMSKIDPSAIPALIPTNLAGIDIQSNIQNIQLDNIQDAASKAIGNVKKISNFIFEEPPLPDLSSLLSSTTTKITKSIEPVAIDVFGKIKLNTKSRGI